MQVARTWAGDDVRGRAVRIALAFVAVFALTYVCVAVPREIGRVAPVWAANAALLALVLRSSARQPELLLAGLVAGVLARTAAGDPQGMSLAFGLSDIVEVAALAAGLRAALKEPLDPTQPRHLVVFIALALAASALSASLAAAALWALRGEPVMRSFVIWTLSDTLGLVIVTPCLLILREARSYLREAPFTRQGGLALLLVVAGSVIMFGQSRIPLMFAAPALLAVAAGTMEVLGAAISVLLLTFIALAFMATGHGPVMLLVTRPTERIILFQLFLAVSTTFALVVGALHLQRRRLGEALAAARDVAEMQAGRARVAEAEIALREARFRQLAENATDIITYLDLDDTVLYASPACRRLGYEPEELVGAPRGGLVHPHDTARLDRMFEAVLRGAPIPPPGEREYRLRSKDGRWVWIEGSPSLVRDDQGTVVGVVSLLRDITQRKAMESQLAQAVAAAEAATAAKAEFLANVSHELRTPLTAILGFSSVLSGDRGLSPRALRYADRIAGASRALLTSINDLLDYSELEAGKMRFARAPLRPLQQACAIMDIFAPQAEAKQLKVDVQAPGVPDRVLADGDRVRQVLFNLISNAVKFTHEGGVILRIGYDPAQSTLSYAVSDTGPGIDDGDARRLFQRFAQFDRDRGGAGLGLAICKSVVEAMGGQIGMRPSGQGGAEFWFEIPAPVAGRDQIADGAADAPGSLAGVRVLVAEDQADSRDVVRALLEPFQVELTEAEDGLAACAHAAEAPFDVILMNLQMPRLDGSQAALRIRNAQGPNQDTPIIGFSSRDGDDRAPRDLPAVFDAHLEKPLSRESLRTTLAQWAH